mmetsp:Transcript_112156/g.219900  ORF Transcript_112156/g.219900 Transcript_112156/m.219900 type:complete len:129 (+) Transcript_112156:2309-2695(+)
MCVSHSFFLLRSFFLFISLSLSPAGLQKHFVLVRRNAVSFCGEKRSEEKERKVVCCIVACRLACAKQCVDNRASLLSISAFFFLSLFSISNVYLSACSSTPFSLSSLSVKILSYFSGQSAFPSDPAFL